MFCNLSHKDREFYPTIIRGGASDPQYQGVVVTYIGHRVNLYRDCCRESCSLFVLLRHRTPSSPIRLSEVSSTPFALW